MCIGVCGLSTAAEIRAESVSAQAESEPMDTSWMDEEVILELDENNMDENGCTYKLSSDTEGTAEMENIQMSRYQDSGTDSHIRVPDRVVKEGKEYVVTRISISPDEYNVKMRAGFCFYMGKEVRDIDWQGMPCASICYPHRESEYFVEENGVLFNRDKTELIHFNNKYYGADKVYEIQETVSKIRDFAFECAQIREVVLNDKITYIPCGSFRGSTLQKIDLKKVNLIEDYAFYECKMLKEVRMRQEGISIRQRAFAWSGIESLYLPPDTCVDCCADFSGCDNLKTVIIGGELRIEERGHSVGLFSGCSSLQTVILPDNMSDIMEDMFAGCLSLRKLFVPESVKTIGERAFNVNGNLTLYVKVGSPAAAYEDNNVSVVDMSIHTNAWKEVLFMKYDTWGVKGKYCGECGCGAEIAVVDFDGGGDKDIPLLEVEGDVSWMEKEAVLELDENNMDENGCTYELSPDAEGTAKLKEIQMSRYQDREKDIHIRVPDRVVKEGKEYIVTCFSVSPDDSNTKVKAGFCFYMGREVNEIRWMKMPSACVCYPHRDSEYFAIENGVLFNRDRTELIHFSNQYYGPDEVYEIPETVSEIRGNAFEGAEIGEVVLNDKITTIPWMAFSNSTLKKIDLKNVNTIEGSAFSWCKLLKEVRIRQEGVSIQQWAFDASGIESLYLPPGACVDCRYAFFRCDDLKTIILGEGFKLQRNDDRVVGLFDGCSSLQTVILPEDMPEIMEEMFAGCMSLRKLNVPDSVETIGERAFYVKGDLTLYAKKGSPAAAYEDDNVKIVDVSSHTHVLRDVLFMKYDTWGVKGKYCEECGYGTELEMVEFRGDEGEDIPLLETEEDTCPEVQTLDANNTDEQGVIYSLDAGSNTASVVDLDNTRPFPREYIALPETVEKNGIRYTVEVVREFGLSGAKIVVLSDTVKELRSDSVSLVRKLVLGKGVKNIHSGAFDGSLVDIEIRGENPYYKMVDGVLYTSDMKKLLRRTGNGESYFEKEYKIPTTVTKIMKYAFRGNYQLDRIDIYNCGEIEIEDMVFDDIDAEICYSDGYTRYDLEDTVVDLDQTNQDENGFVYELNGAYKTADLDSIDLSRYDKNTKELAVWIPDWVRKEGKTYKVTRVAMNLRGMAPEDLRIRLFIGKYVTDLGSLCYCYYKMTVYDNLENDAFISEQGSLFDRGRKGLYRFCDENYDGSSMYKLPEETESIYDHAFGETDIRRVDTNQVREIGGYAFYGSASLEEVILRREGMHLQTCSFSQTDRLRYLYIPCNSKLQSMCFDGSGLRAIVMGEGSVFTDAYGNKEIFREHFYSCKKLETCILPETLTILPESAFADCLSLKKLYIPQGVGEVGEECFANVPGSIYGEEGGAVEESVKNSGTAQFVSLKNHTHQLEQVTFFSYDTWAVTGNYCRECAYATQCARVELEDEADKAELPPMLITETPEPTKTSEPTQEPEKSAEPTEGATVPPATLTNKPIKSAEPSSTPTKEPAESPVAPTEEPSENPSVTPTTVPTTVPKPEPTHGLEIQLHESAVPASAAPDVIRKSDPFKPTVKGFKIFTKNNKSVHLQWKGGGSVTSYRIFRSRKKKAKYQVVKTVAKNRNYYVDKKIKPALKYYYKVRALGYFDGREMAGKESPVRSICVSGIRNPKISVKKGRMQQARYVSVYLRKYQGQYADIHISINKKKFKKLKLVSNKISKYKGKFKIQYIIKNKEIRFKVRTYRKKGKKKLYSNFSNVVRVRV